MASIHMDASRVSGTFQLVLFLTLTENSEGIPDQTFRIFLL